MRVSFPLFTYLVFWFGLMLLYLQVYYRMEYADKGILSFVSGYYPLFFLPLFLKNSREENSLKSKQAKVSQLLFVVEILVAFSLFFFSLYKTGFLSISLFSVYWLGILGFQFLGLEFFYSARLIFFLCPPFSYKWSLLFGSGLRTTLTEHSVFLLQKMIGNVSQEGNLIYIGQELFTIDPECEGLKMLSALVFFHLLSLALWKNQTIRLSQTVYFLFLIPVSILLWYLTNLTRIVLLVLGRVPPTSVWHEGIGIVLFLAMVVFPIFLFYLLGGNIEVRERRLSIKENYFSVGFLFALLILTQIHTKEMSPKPIIFAEKLGEFVLEEVDESGAIASYGNSESRFILKKNIDFFRLSHHPRHCWTASGYRFVYEKDYLLPTGEIVKKAQIEKGGKTLELYWWYELSDSEKRTRTANEWEWRKLALRETHSVTQVNVVLPVTQKLEEFLSNFPKNLPD